jgi:hypothetical protein
MSHGARNITINDLKKLFGNREIIYNLSHLQTNRFIFHFSFFIFHFSFSKRVYVPKSSIADRLNSHINKTNSDINTRLENPPPSVVQQIPNQNR